MIAYPAQLKAVGGARTGIAPVNLLDVQDVNGNLYFWSDRACQAPIAITGFEPAYALPPVPVPAGQFVAWAYPNFVATADGTYATATKGNTSEMSQNGTVNSSLQLNRGAGGSASANVIWSSFKLPPLPGNAVIQALQGVIGAVYDCPDQGPGGSIVDFPGTGAYEDQFTGNPIWVIGGGSLLTAEETLAIASSQVTLDDTVLGTVNDFIDINFVGIAIYYKLSGGSTGWEFPGENAYGAGPYVPWLVSVPGFTFHRSLQTDIGAFVLQNLSGDTLSRDFEKIARRSALEGAFFIYRLWQADAQYAWLEVHGTLTVNPVGVDTVKLKGQPLINPSQEDTPLELYCETCQIQWGGRRCGSTEATQCEYSFQTCQVVERPFLVLNHYEKNYGEAAANTVSNQTNRRRKI